MSNLLVKNEVFKNGIVNKYESKAIPRGAASAGFNFLTQLDKIELTRGRELLGTEVAGLGEITGLHTAQQADGTEVLYRSYGTKVQYYNESTSDWVDVATITSGEEVAFANYHTTAGAQKWFCTSKEGPYKVMTANPADAVDQYDATKNYRGKIEIKDNRMFIWDRDGDRTGLYLSFIDSLNQTDVAAEVVGALGSQTYSGTLAFKGNDSPKEGDFTVNATTDIFTLAGHPFSTGDIVRATTTDTLPSGMSASSYYYVEKINANTFYLFTDSSLKIRLDVASVGVGTHSIYFAGLRRTCFGILIEEAGGEVFTDDYNGNLTGSAGGTGTINYATGAYSVTFNAVTVGNVTADYSWEDATNGGIADTTYSTPRVAGEGDVFRQDVGGDKIMNIKTYGSDIYSFKDNRIYRLTLTADDTDAANIVYREKAGSPYWKSQTETEEGIFFIDDSTKYEASLRILRTGQNNDTVIPVSATESFALGNYDFSECDMVTWGDYVAFTGRTTDVDYNNRLFLFHRVYRSIDVVNWSLSRLEVYDGALIGGDSVSNNCYTLFSGFDDEDFGYEAEWESSLDNLDIDALKKTKRLRVNGAIGPDQKIYVYVAYDNDDYGLLIDGDHPEGCIDGQGSYIDTGASVAVGAVTLGRAETGGGGDGITAYNYKTEFKLNSGKFERIKLKFKITSDNTGYASVSLYEYFDIRPKRNKLVAKYR